MGLAYVRITINLLVLISDRQAVSHLFWRAALARVRFVRKVFWEGYKQTGVSDPRQICGQWGRTMTDLSVCLETSTVLSLPWTMIRVSSASPENYTLYLTVNSNTPTITRGDLQILMAAPGLARCDTSIDQKLNQNHVGPQMVFRPCPRCLRRRGG